MADDTKDDATKLAELTAQHADMQKQVDALRAKNDELLTETKAAKKARHDTEEKAKGEIEEAARKAGDVGALEKSWQEKFAKREAELNDAIQATYGQLRNVTVNATANSIAAVLAVQGSASVLLPHIERRLSLETRDGKPVLVVLDKDGKPSAATVDELKQEISNNPAFAPLIVGSMASGAGGSAGKGGGAAKREMTRANFESLSAKARSGFFKDGGTLID